MRSRGGAGAGIQLQSVSKRFRAKAGTVIALENVSLDIGPGEFVSLLGKSGCGKSTLLAMIGGLTDATSGRIIVGGKQVTGPQTQMGFVFQAPTLLRWRTAIDNVLLQGEAKGLPKRAARDRAQSLLNAVGLGAAAGQRPAQLSGGMQQRVGICRALLHDPGTLLMDEPYSALDEITRDEMAMQLQKIWMQDQRTVVFVTHSIAEAALLSDRVVVLGGRPSDVVLDLKIDLPRPRSLDLREDPAFGEYTRKLRSVL